MSAVVFDLGGVLLDWDPRHLYRGLIPDPAQREDFLARICTDRWHRQHDLGTDTAQSCRELAREHPQYRDLIMAWAERGEEMVAGQLDDTVDVLAELQASGMPCYALSNMEPDTYLLRRARFAFMRSFDGAVISGLEGVAKPDERIFAILAARYGLDPAATVFIDDKQPNVDAARSLGFRGLRFTSARQLRRELREHGVPVGGEHDGA